MRDEGELVTGDAVVLDLHLAKSASRAVGFGLDVLVQWLSLLGVVLVFATAGAPDDRALLAAIVVGVQLLVAVGYATIFETLSRGKTLGKLAMGLRTVRDDGGPITFRQALIRALAGFFVDFGPFGAWGAVGFLVSLSSRDGKRVGDYLAGTVVIRERVPRQAGSEVAVMPYRLAAWAAGLDLSGLPDELALRARQYLGRFHELNQASQTRLGMHIADEVAQSIGVPVPPGVYAWEYLSAVLAERRRRAFDATPATVPTAAAPVPAEPATNWSVPGGSAGGTGESGASSEGASEGAEEASGPFTPPG